MKVLFLMILLHCIDDFYLQTRMLSSLKQKNFWCKYDTKYKNDWIPSMIIHCFEWAIMINIPLFFFANDLFLTVSILGNSVIHFIVDNLKANDFKINLCIDQSIHFIQILITFCLFKLYF